MVDEGEGLEHSFMWLLDSRCSSHMIGRRELFHQLNETVKHKIRLRDNKEVEVHGISSIAVNMPEEK